MENEIENGKNYYNYFDSTPLLDSYCKELQSNGINIIKENDLFEQSAIIIQSIFSGYLAKNKFEALLYNYKYYNQANEILEELFKSCSDNVNYKSCKIFKMNYAPFSLETEVRITRNRYIDLFLHKEIGERFNILNEKINREKEIEKKHKEENDGINDK